MSRKRFVLPVMAVLFITVVTLTKCEGGGSGSGAKDSSNTHVNAPAPDNNSATNPSLGDTAFQKDSSGRRRDSGR